VASTGSVIQRVRSGEAYEAKRQQYAENARRIGWVLRAGVMSASALVALGLILFFAGHGGPDTRDQALGKGVDLHPLSVSNLYHGIIDGDGPSVIQLGLIVLLLTPTTRVALTLLLFLHQRDRVYIILSSIVLIVLLLGFFGFGE
jgi:uncharacterized membrane protein